MSARTLAGVCGGVALLFLPLACGSGGASGPGGGAFLALRTEPSDNGVLFLNQSIAVDFSAPVDLTTADLNTVAFQVFDAQGKALAEQPQGSFRIARSPGDAAIGRRLEFEPNFPTDDNYQDGGLRPGRTYVMQLVGAGKRGHVLRSLGGRALGAPATFTFRTANGSKPSELFKDTKIGGPRRAGFRVEPTAVQGNQGVALLSKAGQALVQVILEFDQPLNPHSSNVAVDLDPDPLRRGPQPGRIYLRYTDPDPNTDPKPWIANTLALTSNTLIGAEVRLVPIGVLPNNATIEVVVDATLEDMAGESNASDPTYEPVFATFRTQTSLEPQFDAVLADFRANSPQIDFAAPFVEPIAEAKGGVARAAFDFDGSSSPLVFEPNTASVVLDTDFTQIQPKNAPAFNVSGGVFKFGTVRIPRNVTVRGIGTKPMVWLVNGRMDIEGTLTVSGGDGESVGSVMSANIPIGGGLGACGGGNGGQGSPQTTSSSPTGENGRGPGQVSGGGGGGGLLSAFLSCGHGSGGGGGGFATAGDPNFKIKGLGLSGFAEQRGVGGYGCTGQSGSATRSLTGGAVGPLAFVDARSDNDFWGSGVDLNRLLRITGELSLPRGGSGGGGGGDSTAAPNNPNWIVDAKGGGGGGGGGVLIIQALDTIHIGASGRVLAEGGNGGGGQAAGTNSDAGGGGGGSGGMVVLIAGNKIEIEAHGETYANGDYDFAVSADGGVGLETRTIRGKYPPPLSAGQWDQRAAGGFGGMGLVQLMAPAGDNSDGTNTRLDDGIEIFVDGNRVTDPLVKTRYLAWRGFFADQMWRDDFGNPTYANGRTADDEGDLRPAPILLPSPIHHKSRLRSKWIDTGASERRPVAQFGIGPRAIEEDPASGLLAGPAYSFAGTNPGGSPEREKWKGYLDYEPSGPGLALPAPEVARADVDSLGMATYAGQPAYRVQLQSRALGDVVDRYAQYQAQLVRRDGIAAGSVAGEYRIIAHDARSLWLSPDQGVLPTAGTFTLRVLAKFVAVETDGVAGLGPVYTETVAGVSRTLPTTNLRIGFAFHRHPNGASPTQGDDPDRLPSTVGEFLYDLADPAVQERVRAFGAPFVMWDVLFNLRYSEQNPDNTSAAPLRANPPRPELRLLALPYRF